MRCEGQGHRSATPSDLLAAILLFAAATFLIDGEDDDPAKNTPLSLSPTLFCLQCRFGCGFLLVSSSQPFLNLFSRISTFLSYSPSFSSSILHWWIQEGTGITKIAWGR